MPVFKQAVQQNLDWQTVKESQLVDDQPCGGCDRARLASDGVHPHRAVCAVGQPGAAQQVHRRRRVQHQHLTHLGGGERVIEAKEKAIAPRCPLWPPHVCQPEG